VNNNGSAIDVAMSNPFADDLDHDLPSHSLNLIPVWYPDDLDPVKPKRGVTDE